MAAYLAAGIPAQIVRVGHTTLFRVAADYLGDALYWTRVAIINGLTDPWIGPMMELKVPLRNADWPTDGILGSWIEAANVVAAPVESTPPTTPVAAPKMTIADIQALLPYLPTELPDAAGVLWNNGGVICVS